MKDEVVFSDARALVGETRGVDAAAEDAYRAWIGDIRFLSLDTCDVGMDEARVA